MTQGLFNIGTNDFYELKNKLVIGTGQGSDILIKGELAVNQAQVILVDNEAFIKNLDMKFPVYLNRKILPEKFLIPILHFSLVEVGGVKFIYSEEGPPRTFQIKKVLEDFEMLDPSQFDKDLLDQAGKIQLEIDEITQKIKPLISEMEKIKTEINKLLQEKNKLQQDYEKKTHEFHLKIQELKKDFDNLKGKNSIEFEQLNKKRTQFKRVLKEASAAKPSTKLELDK